MFLSGRFRKTSFSKEAEWNGVPRCHGKMVAVEIARRVGPLGVTLVCFYGHVKAGRFREATKDALKFSFARGTGVHSSCLNGCSISQVLDFKRVLLLGCKTDKMINFLATYTKLHTSQQILLAFLLCDNTEGVTEVQEHPQSPKRPSTDMS